MSNRSDTTISLLSDYVARVAGQDVDAIFYADRPYAAAWSILRDLREEAAWRSCNDGETDIAAPVRWWIRLAGAKAADVLAARGIPPMSGGSPWAARDTGWHADGCLCRSCR